MQKLILPHGFKRECPEEVTHFIKFNAPRIKRLCNSDTQKAVLWFFSPNRNFGDKEPVDLITAGEANIVQDFIDDAMKQLDDKARQEDKERCLHEFKRNQEAKRAAIKI